jgi:hypothetical protein
MKLQPFALVAVATLLLGMSATAGDTPSDDPHPPDAPTASEGALMRALLGVYIHGISPEIARREVGTEAVPAILERLRDPSFPRRDNLVAFLAHLGTDETVRPLLEMLDRPPAGVAAPEEDRALLLAPRALGRLASRGAHRAQDALLSMTTPGSGGGVLARAAAAGPDPERLRADLLEAALAGLALSGGPEARERLALYAVEGGWLQDTGRDLRAAARRALALLDEHGTVPASGPASRTEDPAGPVAGDPIGPSAAPPPDLATQELDPQLRTGDLVLDYANHRDVTLPLNDVRLDFILGDASRRLGRDDFEADLACCIVLSRGGTTQEFGETGDGRDVIDDSAELDAVLDDATARVKVVRAINYCDGPGENILGCADSPGDSFVVVRTSSALVEAVVWSHELGHSVGLTHVDEPRFIMSDISLATNDGVTQLECDGFHDPDPAAAITPADIGACDDGDADAVHDLVDNCPEESNFEQTDFDGDGTGNACEGPVTLLLPDEGMLFYPDDAPPAFTWEGGSMSRFAVDWSRSDDFRKPKRSRAQLSGPTVTLEVDAWVKALKLGKDTGTVFWRVRASDPEGNRETTAHRSFLVAAARAPTDLDPPEGTVLDPEVPPTFTWDPNHNGRFRVILATNPDLTGKPRVTSGKGTSLSFAIWTPSERQWRKVVERLAARSPDGKVWIGVQGKDSLGRKTDGAVVSFTIGPGTP